MKNEILLGDEAVGLAAVHAGLSAAYSYPGTPASEILEFLIKASDGGKNFVARWSVNEKVAFEEALGVSFAGKRAMVSFKHVGLNVAADPFMNSALTGSNGGLVVVSADDPSMHSSQNEQDNRIFADFARVFCFEPSNHQEAYDMTRQAFDLSEGQGIPVMLRLVTRLAHSRSSIRPRPGRPQNGLKLGRPSDWTLLPVNARRRFRTLVERQAELVRISNESEFNRLEINPGNRFLAVIASGIAYNYVKENYGGLAEPPSLLKVSTYPVPAALISRLVEQAETILVAEEGYPFIEKSIKGLFGIPGRRVVGRLTGDLPSTGELSPDLVRKALGLAPLPGQAAAGFELAGRPPQLCAGCPHADTFRALNKALEGCPQANVFSDIGCYTLAAYPPYESVDTCVCMGASIGMAKAGAEAGIDPSVAVIGDSTFGHSGLTPLLEAATLNTNMTVVILDNGIVAMTGGQPSYATGAPLLRLVEGLGVPREHIRVIEPLPKNLDKNAAIFKEEFGHRGISVIIPVRECVQYGRKK